MAELPKPKGGNYGISDFSRGRVSEGALRTDHRRLPETAGMVQSTAEEKLTSAATSSCAFRDSGFVIHESL
jgi:hypothetical protein